MQEGGSMGLGSILAGIVLVVVGTGVLVAVGWCLWRFLTRGRSGPVEQAAAGEEERQSILKMMNEGKITSGEASELLRALGKRRVPGDSLPISRAMIVTVIGAVLIVIGFMLPWQRVWIGRVSGYQAGYHVGFLGWLILGLGLLPAILSSIPAMDKVLRQGLLRLLLCATGIAFAVSLAIGAGRSVRIGIFLLIFGFMIQLISALVESGLAGGAPQRETAQD